MILMAMELRRNQFLHVLHGQSDANTLSNPFSYLGRYRVANRVISNRVNVLVQRI